MKRILFYVAKYRLIFIMLTTIYVIFFCAQLLLRNPTFDFTYRWDRGNNSIMVVDTLPENAPYAGLLQEGDIIHKVDGETVIRGRQIFSAPTKASYELTIVRDGVEDTVTVLPTENQALIYENNMPAILLSLGFLIVGAFVLYYAQYENTQGLLLGLICILTGIHIINTQAYAFNVSNPWILYSLLGIFLVPAWIFLGFLPISDNLSTKTKTVLRILIIFSVVFSVAAFYEQIALFPQRSSFAQLAGINLQLVTFVLLPLAFLVNLLTLIIRWRTEENTYIKNQLKIIIIGTALALGPTLLLTFMPGAIWGPQGVILPFPIAITLWFLIPASYAYVIFRRKYLSLDSVFKTGFSFVITFLSLIAIYGLILLVVNRDSLTVATLVLMPAFIVATVLKNPVQGIGISLTANPGEKEAPEIIDRFTAQFSQLPEQSVMIDFLQNLAVTFEITRYVFLVLNDKTSEFEALAQLNAPHTGMKTVPDKLVMRDPYSGDSNTPLFDWADLGIPIVMDRRTIGFLVFSKPEASFFTQNQVQLLESAANLIGIALYLIDSIDAIKTMSARQLAEQQRNRRLVAQELHDTPMQQLTDLGVEMNQFKQKVQVGRTKDKLAQLIQKVNQIETSIRGICAGLLPPMLLHEGPDYILESVSDYARRLDTQQQITINLHLQNVHEERKGEDFNLALYHIATEAVTNAVRHAQATEIDILFDGKGSYLMVQDNGIGIKPFSFNQLVREEHYGLAGMYNWAQYAEGHVTVQSNGKTQGTCVKFTWNGVKPDALS